MDHPNANIVTSSFDRIQGTYAAPVYQPYNNFRIQNLGGNIVQGQLNKISITELMFPYTTPTIVAGQNDSFLITVGQILASGQYEPVFDVLNYTIPAGWYDGTELVAALNALVSNYQFGEPTPVPISDYLIFAWDDIANRISIESSTAFNSEGSPAGYWVQWSYNFTEGGGTTPAPSATVLRNPFNYPAAMWTLGFRNLFAQPPVTYDVDGEGLQPIEFNIASTGAPLTGVPSNAVTRFAYGQFFTGRYTDYIDVVSSSLCQAQYTRDTTTSQNTTRRDVIARIYVCNDISTIAGTQEGTRPFIIHRMFPVPKIMKWTADRSIDAIELSLFDMYGQPLPNTLNTNIPYDDEGTPERNADAGESDYAITFHVHEPSNLEQNENVGYKF
jgi:hypothetical protein